MYLMIIHAALMVIFNQNKRSKPIFIVISKDDTKNFETMLNLGILYHLYVKERFACTNLTSVYVR